MSRIVKADKISLDPARRYEIDSKPYIKAARSEKADVVLEPHYNTIISGLHVNTSKTEAEKIINDAIIEAESIKAQAEETRQLVQKEAWNKGFESGYQDGLEQGIKNAERQYQDMYHEVQELKEQVLKEKQELMASVEKDAVRLSLHIAERIIHKEVELDSGIIVDIIKSVIKHYQIKSDISIKLSTYDVEAIRHIKDTFTETALTADVNCDDSLNRGDCIIDLGHSVIDAGTDTQLAKLGDAFGELDSI